MDHILMTRAEIISSIDKACFDGQIACYYDTDLDIKRETEDAGDTLAEFVVRELYEGLYADPSAENVDEALRFLSFAITDLEDAREAVIQLYFKFHKSISSFKRSSPKLVY